MREINISADTLVFRLLNLEKSFGLCLLDSCGISRRDASKLIAGIKPVKVLEIKDKDVPDALGILDEIISAETAVVFTVSYDFGLKLNKIKPRKKEFAAFPEPDIFAAIFEVLIIHDYDSKKTFLDGKEELFDEIEKILDQSEFSSKEKSDVNVEISSNFSHPEYLKAIEKVKEEIFSGNTYQTNLTRRILLKAAVDLPAGEIFLNLRRKHPSPFSAFLTRQNDVVISASPERFLKIEPNKKAGKTEIFVSPIKGTRPRGKTLSDDLRLREELLGSAKDRAENVMIVDLMRNDIGRICEYGTVKVEELCALEEYPTLFHLVSTISGTLEKNTIFSDVLRAVFPCGSITGAPKIRTMRIIDELETVSRGLSMGAIGCKNFGGEIDLSVAIRTMNVRDNQASFNVGGGITIDSNPQEEYEETAVKSRALLSSVSFAEKI